MTNFPVSLQKLLTFELHFLRSSKLWWMYLLTCFVLGISSTFLMETVILGAEKGAIPVIQRNLWLHKWMLLPLGLIGVSLQLFKQSLDTGFIKEYLIQGYSRKEILLSKCILLLGFSTMSHGFILVPAVFLTFDQPVFPSIWGILLSIQADFFLMGVLALLSHYSKSRNSILLITFGIFGLDLLFRLFFLIGPTLFSALNVEVVRHTLPLFLPLTAYQSWMVWEESWSVSMLGIAIFYTVGIWGFVFQQWKSLKH